MPPNLLLAGLLLWAPPAAAEERGIVEVGVAAEVLYPPSRKEPGRHPSYGAAVSASFHRGSRFKAMVGFGFDHVVYGWLGDPDKITVARHGDVAGTEPRNFRGQLYRLAPVVRVGAENEIAFGYVGASAGYAIRTAELDCVNGPCSRSRSVEHGMNLGLSLGAMFSPSKKVGLVLGGEVGLDWAWFPTRHPALAPWNQAMSARLIAGWGF